MLGLCWGGMLKLNELDGEATGDAGFPKESAKGSVCGAPPKKNALLSGSEAAAGAGAGASGCGGAKKGDAPKLLKKSLAPAPFGAPKSKPKDIFQK